MPNLPRTMFEKIWDAHVVHAERGKQTILYIDLHLVHEVTSAAGLRGAAVGRAEGAAARADRRHARSQRADDRSPLPIADPISKQQIDTLRKNCQRVRHPAVRSERSQQGIVHVIGPELGLTQPGMTIVCGDSHTATHGAFGALAFGIGTSEVEHVLATQTLLQYKPKTMEIRVDGRLAPGVTAKDLILYLIGQITTDGGTGYCIEYTGSAIRASSMEERMTVCNMSIEAGARAGMIAPDEKTFDYLRGREFAPHDFDAAVALAEAAQRSGRRLRPRGTLPGRRRRAASHLGDEPGPGRAGRRARCPTRPRFDNETDRKTAASRLGIHGPEARHADRRRAARPRVHRLMHQQPHRGPAGRRRRRPRLSRCRRRGCDGRARQRSGQAAGRSAKGSTVSSARPASSGARPAAACAWA